MADIYIKTEKNSETGKKVTALIDKSNAIIEKTKAILKELGASAEYVSSGIFATGIEAVQFKNEPDMKIWKVKRFKALKGRFFAPRLGSKKGKEIQKKFDELGKITRDDLNKCIGINEVFFSCGFRDKENAYTFSLDSRWNAKIPDDCVEIAYSQFN